MPGNLSDVGAIETDRYDRRTWNRILEESERIQAAVKEEPFQGLMRDVWASLFKASPHINEQGPTVNRRVMENLMRQTAWKDLRQTTQMDEYSAALGSLSLRDALEQAMPEDVRHAAHQVQDLEQQLQQLLDQAEAYQEAANAMPDSQAAAQLLDQIQALQKQAADLMQTLQQATDQFEQAFDAQSGSIGRAVRQALEQAVQEAQEDQRMMQAFGVGMGDGKPVSGKERLELAHILRTNPHVREIARMAGRMQMMALNKRKNRTIHPPTEIVNITMGDDLANILPSELLLLADPATEDDFIQRFAERRLLQYDLRGFEREGQGPIVVCLDESGSTAGTVEIWEKGIALALFAIARRERRAFAVVHFGSEPEIFVQKWPRPKDASPVQLVEMAQHFFNGGTNFERPLKEAVQIMDEASFKKGDIVFITDGESRVSDKFLHGEFARVKNEKEFQVISVVIGYDDRSVRPFSDVIAKPQVADDATLSFVIEALQ
ncbi:von Willebrand factor type A domain-containing protein [Alicyclobacillus macrosporangiidus]|uniref:von Willebrand factor type A domain-containing protein n=1 Tax=Alicyclobacillus macrosporangiidus TaxID=392015 RepID=A0A1I7KEP9_9BACL|nr:von Willebrand factor type A domain-containing protein [Alicyclobacillus macrosporangiidus]